MDKMQMPHSSFPLSKAIHNALCIDDFWFNFPYYEQRACCASCNTISESLEHILFDCENPTAYNIWQLARWTWPTSFGLWPEVSLGLVLGCGSIALPQPENDRKKNNNPSQLLHILISKSAHLIWSLCCECTIQNYCHSLEESQFRWQNKINHRINLDKHIVMIMNHKPITCKIVKDTWEQILTEHLSSLTQTGFINQRF